MANSRRRARYRPHYQPKPRRRCRSGQAASQPSEGVLTFVEGGAADFLEPLQIAAQSAHIGPGDLVRRAIEMIGTEGSKTGKDRVDFSFAGNEGCDDICISKCFT